MLDITINRYTFALTLEDVKSAIAEQKYMKHYSSCKAFNDANIEDDIHHGVPMMNKVFYEMFISSGVIPSWQSFLCEYKIRHCVKKPNGKLTFTDGNPRHSYEFDEPALDKKLIRAYMSFLKEVYVMFWFFDKKIDSVYYSLENDIAGFDISLFHRGRLFGIKIYANTYDANKFAKIKKSTRNHLPENSVGIAIRSDFNSYNRLGDTYVFHEGVLKFVYGYVLRTMTFQDIVV